MGDNGYAVLDLPHCCQSLREPVTLITRLRRDAGLYDPAPPRPPGQPGRPRVKGSRQPTLKQRLDDPDLPWDTVSVSWYDGAVRTLELSSPDRPLVPPRQTARAHPVGAGSRPRC
ncbi:MAG: hypothetical protein OXE87_01335 [Chloroflexi bacterium]|nr:hypothetical protein [Chloroflexota bacterium]